MSGFIKDEFFQYARWTSKKNLQVFIRKDLSHWLALLLALLVVYRETPELAARFGRTLHLPMFSVWYVVFVTLATIGVATWESFGNKSKISHQETTFLYGMRTVLEQLQMLVCAQDDPRPPNARLKEFVTGTLNIASETFSVYGKSDTGLMVKRVKDNSLKLDKSSRRAEYPEHLSIRVPAPAEEIKDPASTGPAGIAFSSTRTVYVPRKGKHVWSFRRERYGNKEWYVASMPVVCWVSAGEEYEKFRSVLCVPVAAFRDRENVEKYGVLNVSTNMRDPFVNRDFMMAECFAAVLGIAFAWARETARNQ